MDMAGIAHSLWICECKPHRGLREVRTNKSEYLSENEVFRQSNTAPWESHEAVFWLLPYESW